MKKAELEDLSSSIPLADRDRVKLPVILLRRTDLGIGAYTVLGDPFEEYSVSLVAGSFVGSFEEFKREQSQSPTILYKPQISQLLRRFHSLITIGFGSALSKE